MPSSFEIEGFWDFSVRTYRTHGVPEACLSLQNDYGADVNLLLYCCWIGRYIGKFDSELFGKASGFSTNWADNVVVPLRSARSWMKHTGCLMEPIPSGDCMKLREEIKSVEFASEELQQRVLESLVTIDESRSDDPVQILKDAVANLDAYAGYKSIKVNEEVRRKFSVITDAAFPDE